MNTEHVANTKDMCTHLLPKSLSKPKYVIGLKTEATESQPEVDLPTQSEDYQLYSPNQAIGIIQNASIFVFTCVILN